jgi:SPP1 family predicted phage head-tail adaptor
MYDGVAYLISAGQPTYDEYGREIQTETERMVYVQPMSVYQAEFYNAAQLGLRPSLRLHLANRADYLGEKVLVYEGETYTVIRADWKGQRDGIDLVLEHKVGTESEAP